MKKVPDVSGVRKRGRPPKKRPLIEASAPLTAGEGAQLSDTDALELDVHVAQTSADASGSEKPTLSSKLNPRNRNKSVPLDSVKMTGRKRRQTSSERSSSDGKISAPSRRSFKDKMKTFLSKAVKQKSQKVSLQVQSSSSRPLGRGRPKKELQISQKRKAKLGKFGRSKISIVKSIKTQTNELNDSVTAEMKRLLTTDGFWSTKASSHPQSQSVDSNLQKQATASKKDSRTSTPDSTPSGTRSHSLSKTRLDKEDSTLQRSNIPISELRRLRTTDGFSFPEAAGASRTSSRDVSPCSSSSLDRGARLNSRPVSRLNENKNGVKIDDVDPVTVANEVLPARNKMKFKKENCSGKGKLPGDQKEVPSTIAPTTADENKFINCESPVSRFRKKIFLDKVVNLTKQKRVSVNIQSKKMSLMPGNSRRQRLKSKTITTQSMTGESSTDLKPTSTDVPEVRKDKRVSKNDVDRIAEKTTEKRKKGKKKQRNISNVDNLISQSVLEDGSENVDVPPSAANVFTSSTSSTKSSTSSEWLISDLLGSAELKRLNTTAGFWSASGIETVLRIDKPRKLRDADGNSIKEADVRVKPKPFRQKSSQKTKFSKTAMTPSSLLKLRKKKLQSLQSIVRETKQGISSEDLSSQQQPPVVSMSPAATEESSGRKSRPRNRLFGMRRQQRNRDIILTKKKSKDRNIQEIKTVSESSNFVHSVAVANEAAVSQVLLIDASGFHERHTYLNTSEMDTNDKDPIFQLDNSFAKRDSYESEHLQRNKRSREVVGVDLNSQTMPETSDVEIDISVNNTLTGLKPVVKTSKRGRKKLHPSNVLHLPSSSETPGVEIDTSVIDTLTGLMPVMKTGKRGRRKLRPGDVHITPSSSETPDMKTGKRGRRKLRPGDIHVTPSGSTQTRGRGKIDKALVKSLEVLQNLEPSNEDAVLASSPATSKVESSRQKTEKAKKESLTKLGLSEFISETEINKKQLEVPEVKDSEQDILPDTTVSTAETDNIEKHLHKDNLFESLGYSLTTPSESLSITCVNSSACDSQDLCSLNVAESQFTTYKLPTVENTCDVKLNNVLCVAQTESSAKQISDSIENINAQQLKEAESEVTDSGGEFLNDSNRKLGSGCLDVCHKDSVDSTVESLCGLQSSFVSRSAVSSEPVVQGFVKADALNAISLCERKDYTVSADVAEVKAEILKRDQALSTAVESPSCSERNIPKESITVEWNAAEKQSLDKESEAISEKEQNNTLEVSRIEFDVVKIKPAEPSVEAEVLLPHEDSKIVTSSAGIGLFAQFQCSFPREHLFAEAEKEIYNNVSNESVNDVSKGTVNGNKGQREMLKSSAIDATETAAENVSMSVKSVIDIDCNVHSVTTASDDKLAVPESAQLSCDQNTDTKRLKRKRKPVTKFVRRKVRKHLDADISISLDSASLDVSPVPLSTTYDFSSCEEIVESQQSERLLEANSMTQPLVKRVRKRKRNSWQRGVVRKVTNVTRKVKKSVKSLSPEQTDMGLSVLNSNDATICFADDVDRMDAVTSALISSVSDDNQMSDSLHENILLPASTSNCKVGNPISADFPLCGQPTSAASDRSSRLPDLDDSKLKFSDGNKVQVSDVSEIHILDDSKFKNLESSQFKDLESAEIKTLDDSKIKEVDDSKIPHLDDSEVKHSDDSKIQVSNDNQKNYMSVPVFPSESETAVQAHTNLLGEKESLISDFYTPAVTKSLKNMLKKLQTNANLAHADFGVQSYKGKFLRKIQQREEKQKRLRIKRKLLHADQKAEEGSEGKMAFPVSGALEPQVGISEMPVRKRRGRPKKQPGEALPKLSPVGMLPLLRSVAPWNKTPPDLSPQDVTAPQFLDVSESKSTQDVDIAPESVDDTDLHLYLSGVSDEEQSPRKESGVGPHLSLLSDISSYSEKKDNNISLYETKDNSISMFLEEKDSNRKVKTNIDMHFGAEELLTPQRSVISGKEPKKRGRPKKGSRGRPPGIPMTDEERLKRKDEEKLKRKKALKAFTKKCEDQTLFQFLHTSHSSVDTPDFATVPAFTNASTPSGNFSLRKKSTRSPLEMLAMKRMQEEAKYDMEQERRQARLIHLREKRSARESGEGFSEDEVGEESSENLMTCSVVLNDFVKKLQLDNLELSSGEEVGHEAPDSMRPSQASPDDNPFEDRSEDWRADFQEHDSEEWNNNRPSIPRLKLKRIIKKGAQSQVKSTKLTAPPPKERQHVPIKLVIKSEPVTELNEPAGFRLGSGTESSRVERSSFENSYMDFLNKKSQSAPGKSDVGSKRSYNVSRPAQLERRTQNSATDMRAVEILSLPSTGIRAALAVDTVSSITEAHAVPAGRHLSRSTPVSERAHVQTKVDAKAHPSDKVSSLEHALTNKPALSVDDDEDDILILDLEDGAVEQNSDDLPPFYGAASSAVAVSSGIANAVPTLSHESASENSESHIRSSSLSHLQRSYSNDEMGLMFESYNSHKDSDKLNQLGVLQEATDSFVSIKVSEDLSGNIETHIQSDAAQNCVLKDTSIKATVSLSQSQESPSEVQESHFVGTDPPTVISESSRKGTREISESDSAVVAAEVTDTEEFVNIGDAHEVTSVYHKKQIERDSIPGVNRAADSVIMNTVNKASNNNGLKEGVVELIPSDVSLDNNVTSACTPALKTGSFKKPGPAGDNNKSPKHPTYHGSGPEDWKVKVIHHSDKLLSGKYSCKRCSFTAPAKLAIESHIYSHIPGVQFRCAYCESEFTSMAATSSHLKNTHSLSEAKLHISRHIDEKNFYDKEAAVFSEESGQQSPVHPASAGTNAGGQSPPVIISVVVSSRGGRSSSTPAHRFVCTHCGFSTNVKEDAEHHVLDLHSSQALFACLLCSENVCYTEHEIKDHCATVHPARKHPYKKLPDFYDAELLSLTEKTTSQDDRENIFERMTSLFQDETQPGISTMDHKQKAKEYLYLQEGWKEKTKVEADSTTAVDYPDEHDDTEEQLSSLTPALVESLTENIHLATVGENEVFADHRSSSQIPDDSEGVSDVGETAASINDDFITSSAGATANVSNESLRDPDAGSDRRDQQIEQEDSFSDQLVELPCHAAREPTANEIAQQECLISPDPGLEDNDDDGGGMGLKIVQVVSLSEQNDDLDEQMGTEEMHISTDSLSEDTDACQADTVMSENSLNGSKVVEFSASENSSQPADNVTGMENSASSPMDKDTATSLVTTESSATESSTTNSCSVLSPTAGASFAGGLPLSYKCNACKVHTPYLLMMVKHLKAKHPNMRCFSCPYCKTTQSFVSQKQLRHHVKQSHPTKFGRNEIALSEDAKKFVEAMVLPIGPECIRVGNRIVLEEDIHTCTYCQVKMVTLASVYEHLNTKHSDLFEFVCPVCQSYRSKLLPEIFEHCLQTHKSTLDTDKVHVSVPKNLFTALTCISKSGKYIEKSLGVSPEKIHPGSSTSQQMQKAQSAFVPRRVPQLPKEGQILPSAEQHPFSETSVAATPMIPVAEAVPSAQVMQPIFAVPLTSASIGAVAATARPAIAFSSSLFDTSGLTPPQLAVASHSIPFIQNAAASSFLGPLPQPAHSNHHVQSSKQSHSKSSDRSHSSAKHLPVLNVPTIRPRTSPVAAKPAVGSQVNAVQVPTSQCNSSMMSSSGGSQQPFRPASSSSAIDNLPDDEPNPDAFKIFNLCPTGPRISPSPISSSLPPGVPTVFPPVSAPMAAGYISGPIAGFPPGMVISPNFLPLSFPYHQTQSVMQGLLAQKQNPQNTPLSRHSHLPHTSALMAAQSASTRRNSMPSEEAFAAAYLKKHQQRELYLKKQHQQQQQLESQRHLFRQSQQHAVPRAHPAHQQPPSLSGQVYQPQPLPVQSLPYDHQQTLAGPNDPSHPSLFSTSVPVSSAAGQSGHLMAHISPSPGRPSKGLHKRSSTLYQCPYCTVLVTLKALEVASHIQQHHPGKQVTFRKIS